MQSRDYNINLRGEYNPVTAVYLSQYDSGVELHFHVYDGTEPAGISGGAEISIMGRRPSGVGFDIPCTLVSNNLIIVSTTTDMTGEAGTFPVEIRFSRAGTDIGTVNFDFVIEKAPHPEGTIDADITHEQEFIARFDAMETELEGIRTGTDGTVYDSAGDAVRGQISDLTDGLKFITDNGAIEMTAGAYIGVGDSTININSPTASSLYRYAKIPCVEGDKFTINATATPGPKPYGFCDANGATKDRPYLSSGQTLALTDFVITAPPDAAYLVINDNSGRTSYYGDIITKRTSVAEDKISDILTGEEVKASFYMTPGTLSTSGKFSGSTKRIATRDYIDLKDYDTISYDIDSGYRMAFASYSAPAESACIDDRYWMTGKGTLPKTGRYLRVVFCAVNDTPAVDVTDVDKFRVTLKSPYVSMFNAYESARDNTISESFAPAAQSLQGANSGLKIRVMSYNVAEYDNDTDVHISNGQLLNLRKMLNNADADFLCIQEDQQYIDANDTQDATQYIYYPKYPYKHGTSGGVVRSKVQAVEGGSLNLQYTNGRYLRFGTYQISDNVKLLLISTHPVYNYNSTGGTSAASIAARLTQYTELFQWIKGEITLKDQTTQNDITVPTFTHCVIGLDANSATDDDKTNLANLASQNGFILGNGGYLGWFYTEIREMLSLDNVIVSNNVIINNIEAYSSLYADLYSDHAPVVADLTLL